MVGLKNQGATGYLNAVLQTIYFTNSLRKVSWIRLQYDQRTKSEH